MNDPNSHDVTVDLPGDATPRDGSSDEVSCRSNEHPQRIGRYRIEKVLGRGGFGLVYLAHDEQLHRAVALKVPYARLISRPEDAEPYLAEARTVAKLDHPHIVPVHDVGSTSEFPCYVVSKYVDGTDLASKIKEERLSCNEAAKLVATVAEALHYAHEQGIVHRDVKPGNILIGEDGKPYVLDFGLALQEGSTGDARNYAGTPAYMSPEQARGEGHRVDGRSDVFSLGVVFYQLLTGRQPFRGDSIAELLEQVTSSEPRPPRECSDQIPKELERICQRALAKKGSERYSTARELADDVNCYLAEQAASRAGGSLNGRHEFSTETYTCTPSASPVACFDAAADSMRPGSSSDSHTVKIIPKGLRSFDEHDADFFLKLLPGPRDREGLPDSLRFWKTRIEDTDPDNTFSVGLIYGPSGCGKSSLVKAGLLPRLGEGVISVYVEAASEETETRLLHGLRKQCPAVQADKGLVETLTALRRAQDIPAGRKVLIVLDQFEQWLHANDGGENTQLIRALRQCDGGRVQCIVMVRDDFWMAATRFMRELEVPLLEGRNSAAVDLFPSRHAAKVLAAFGRAFGALPVGRISKDQKSFLTKSIHGLSEEGKVVCVRLALFAEMMKDKPWTPAVLKEVGGTAGLGVAFLDGTFCGSSAPPQHRYHQKAARAVLDSLLPESGCDIKGEMKSYNDLLEASGYANRPSDFVDLVRILDSELRLVTPTEPEGHEHDDDEASSARLAPLYYQLTHDYLVQSLREWLTSKQRETRRGRAALRLAERSAAWHAKREIRHLPSWWEHVNIRLFTDKRKWTEPQKKMMRKAGAVHGVRSAVIAAVIAAVALLGLHVRESVVETNHATRARGLVKALLKAEITQVPMVVSEMPEIRAAVNPLLKSRITGAKDGSPEKLRLALALLPVDNGQINYLQAQIPVCTSTEFPVLRSALSPYKEQLTEALWRIVLDQQRDPSQRFRAACALATYSPQDERWVDEQLARFVAEHLVSLLPSELLPWRNALRPVKGRLTSHLAAVYRDNDQREQVRAFATDTLADYLSDDASTLFDLLADANQQQFPLVFDKLAAHQQLAVTFAEAELTKIAREGASEADTSAVAWRQANAAVMLLQMGAGDKVWPLLQHSPDPRVRSYIIHWFCARGGDPRTILARYEQNNDVTIQRALLLCLGEFQQTRLPDDKRSALIGELLEVYRTHPDAGLHASAEWLLRQWGQDEQIAAIEKDLQQDASRLQFGAGNQRQWYINGQGQTFVVLDAGEYDMGSPESEPGRSAHELRHRQRMERRIAISTKEVTKAQWRVFSDAQRDVLPADSSTVAFSVRTEDSPMAGLTWYEAAQYCNWLSEQEGIPKSQWCYEPNKEGKYAAGMKSKSNFWQLSGYRLPTEAEWEYACRAGTATSRYFGVADSLLPKYAWYLDNSQGRTWPTARLKPNDFGLFDMQGNVIEWCHDSFSDYRQTDAEDAWDQVVADEVGLSDRRVLRGGAFGSPAADVRSAYRNYDQPNDRDVLDGGVRPVRTMIE